MSKYIESWLKEELSEQIEGNSKSEFALFNNWHPNLATRKKIAKENISIESQLQYLDKFIKHYLDKTHMSRTKKEWNNYFYEFCINQEILKFNEAGNSAFCAHDLSDEDFKEHKH